MNNETEHLTQLLTDVPHVDNDDIPAALKDGLTLKDVEWNQRLERPWTFHPTDAKAEAEARVAWFVANGVDAETAKGYVEDGH